MKVYVAITHDEDSIIDVEVFEDETRAHAVEVSTPDLYLQVWEAEVIND